MKKLFAFMIVIVFAIQLSACGVTTENKQTGEVDCTDYWLIKLIDGEPKIICQYENFADTVSELGVYKEFENHEENGLVN